MRVVIGEDEALLRDGLTLVLQREGIDVVACAADADEVVAASARTRPDLVLTDLRMPPTHTDDGLRAAQRIRAEQPGTAVVVLSHHVNGQYAAELLGERARRSATCSSSGSPTPRASAGISAGWPRAASRSTPR